MSSRASDRRRTLTMWIATRRCNPCSTVESSFAWTREAVETQGWLAWLADLPQLQRAVLSDGTRLVGVHASPLADDDAGITPSTPRPTFA